MFSSWAAPLFLSNENVIETSNVFTKVTQYQSNHLLNVVHCFLMFCFVFLFIFIFSMVEIVYITRLILHMIIILANGWSPKNEMKLNKTKCIIIEHRKTICINACVYAVCCTVDEFPNVYGITKCVRHKRRNKWWSSMCIVCWVCAMCNTEYWNQTDQTEFIVRTTNVCIHSLKSVRFRFGLFKFFVVGVVRFRLIECQ